MKLTGTLKPTKKTLGLILGASLVLAACGSSDDAAIEADNSEVATTEVAETDSTADADESEVADPSEETSDGECTPRHEITTVEDGFLTVAAYIYLPFSDVDGETVGGAEGEIITRIAAMECLEIKVAPGDAAAMIPAITAGRADTTIGSWYRTEEREEVVILGAPVIADRLTLISADGVGTIEDLKGHKVGSILGFLWNDDLSNVIGDDLNLYDTTQSMYADLAAGRIDVIVDTFPSAQAVLETTPIEGLQFVTPPADPAVVSTQKPGQSNFPVNQDNPDLATALDENIAELRESGELEEIVVKFGFLPEAADPGEPNKL